MVLFGIMFLLGNLGYMDFTLGTLVTEFWPLVLIYAGVKMISTTYGRRAGSTVIPGPPGEMATLTPGCHRLVARYILGDLEIKADGLIEGGALQIGLGNLEVDLRESGPKRSHAVLECITRVGQVSVRLPEGCEFRVEAFCLAGDVLVRKESRDGIGKSLSYATPGYDSAEKRLLIKARSGVGSVFVR